MIRISNDLHDPSRVGTAHHEGGKSFGYLFGDAVVEFFI